MSTEQKEWSSRELLNWMRDRFQASGIDAPRVVSETLLAKTFDCRRLDLHLHPERPASADERERLRDDVRRVLSGEPLHYVTERVQFWHGSFIIRPCTQIPQPCTELLVSQTLARLSARGHLLGHGRKAADSTFAPEPAIEGSDDDSAPEFRDESTTNDSQPGEQGPLDALDIQPQSLPVTILEAGVGSGAVIVSLLQSLPRATGVGVDLVDDCIRLAEENGNEHGVGDRLQLLLHDVKLPLSGEYDVVVGNLPYIPDSEWPQNIDPGVLSFTPETALRGGPDGLAVIRPLVGWIGQVMRADGIIGLEHATGSTADVVDLLKTAGFRNVESVADEDGLLRCTFGVWPGGAGSSDEC